MTVFDVRVRSTCCDVHSFLLRSLNICGGRKAMMIRVDLWASTTIFIVSRFAQTMDDALHGIEISSISLTDFKCRIMSPRKLKFGSPCRNIPIHLWLRDKSTTASLMLTILLPRYLIKSRYQRHQLVFFMAIYYALEGRHIIHHRIQIISYQH